MFSRHRSRKLVQVPEYPRMLKFMADGALLSLNGEKRVSVVARNVPGMELEIARVLPNQLQHLVGFNRGTYAKPQLDSLNPDQITERFVQKTFRSPKAILAKRISKASTSVNT